MLGSIHVSLQILDLAWLGEEKPVHMENKAVGNHPNMLRILLTYVDKQSRNQMTSYKLATAWTRMFRAGPGSRALVSRRDTTITVDLAASSDP